MKNKNITAISVFALILIVVAGYYFWLPEYRNHQDLNNFLKQKKDMIKQEESYLNELNDQLGEIQKRQEGFSMIESALPPDPSLPALFNFLQTTAGGNGLSLGFIGASSANSIENSKLIDKNSSKPFSVIISATGSYSSFKNFLQSIYKNARIIELNSIGLGRSGTSKEKGIFDFNLQLQTNYF